MGCLRHRCSVSLLSKPLFLSLCQRSSRFIPCICLSARQALKVVCVKERVGVMQLTHVQWYSPWRALSAPTNIKGPETRVESRPLSPPFNLHRYERKGSGLIGSCLLPTAQTCGTYYRGSVRLQETSHQLTPPKKGPAQL